MNKLKYLTQISLKKKMKTKWFLLANLIMFIAIISLVNIDSIVKFFGGDFDESLDILVIDNTNQEVIEDLKKIYLSYESYLTNYSNSNLISYSKTKEEAQTEIANTDNILLVINYDSENVITAELIYDKKIDSITYQVIASSLNTIREKLVLAKYHITDEMVADINKNVTITQMALNNSKTNEEMTDLILNVILPVFILPFFVLTMFLVQMIGAEINEEKTTKSMEIIISNVPAQTHFLSKLLAGNIFVLTQGLLLIIYLVLAIVLRKCLSHQLLDPTVQTTVTSFLTSLKDIGFIDRLVYLIPVSLCLMILTFIAYSLVAAILASMTTNIEDYQQVQNPIVIISVIGYYLSILASVFSGSTFIKVMSYLPFISALLVPSLLSLGQIGFIDLTISFACIIIVIYLLYKYGLKVYKAGILNYSSKNLWGKIFKALKGRS